MVSHDRYIMMIKDTYCKDMEVDVSQNKTSSKSEKSRLIEVTTSKYHKIIVS
jgi:hypothetical protein